MSFSVRGLEVVHNTILTSPEGGMATPLGSRRLLAVRDPSAWPYCQVITVSAHAEYLVRRTTGGHPEAQHHPLRAPSLVFTTPQTDNPFPATQSRQASS